MSEKEKMIANQMYNPMDNELLNDRIRVKLLCQEYNALKYDEFDKRKELIAKIINTKTQNFLIEQPFMCDYGYNITIGDNFYSNHYLTILDCAKVEIGNNVFIGPNCNIYCAEHPLDKDERRKGLEFSKPVVIKDDVWIGGNVTIVSGVTIGSDCVIGANSTVTKSIPDNCVAVGSPCKIIKKL